jgi:hypothetical protein
MEKALTALVSEEDVAAVALGSIMDRAFELKTAKALETYGFSEARWAAEQLQAGRIQLRNARFTQKASATTRTLGVYVPGTYSLWGIGIIGVDFNAMKDNPSKILQTILHEIVHYHDEVAAVWGIANYTQIETEYHAHIAHNKLARASEMRRAGDLSFNQPTWETLFERDFGAGIRANVLSVYAPQLGASTETPVQTTAEQNSRALQVDPLWILTRNSNAQPWQRPQPNHFISYVTPRK